MEKLQKSNKGFSILEMLACVAVIMVTSSLLFSALQSSREKGHKAQCINNQRNLIQAALLFALDEEHFPTSIACLTDGQYIRVNPKSEPGYAYAAEMTLYYNNVMEITRCPKIEGTIMDNPPVYSYGMMDLVKGASYHLIREPSKMIVIADSDLPYIIDSDDVAARHQRGAIAAYADGHVDWAEFNVFEIMLDSISPFELENGGVILNGEYETQVHPLLAQLSYGGLYWDFDGRGGGRLKYLFDFMDMYLDFEITSPEGETTTIHVTDPEGEGLDGWMSSEEMAAFEYTSEALVEGSEINVIATAKWWLPQYTRVRRGGRYYWKTEWTQEVYKSYNTEDDLNEQVFVLKDGDPVPDVQGFYDSFIDEQQTSVSEAIQSYTVEDEDGNLFINLEENQAIYFFEISHTPDRMNEPGYDCNDLIFFIDLKSSQG